MDFLDPKKKRAHQHRLFLGYALVAIALGIATTILVFAASGYGVNRKTGAIIQNGLLFVDSHPDTADVYLNGVDKGKTSNRYVLEEGNYSIEMRRDGYRSWTHDFVMEGGSVERFVYPFLFPSTLKSKDVQLYATQPDLATVSPDRHWIVSHSPSVFTSFDVTDTSTKENVTTTIKVPATVLPTKPNQKLEVVEWSTDNKHVLLKYSYDGGMDFVLLDRETPANTINLTQTFGRSFSQVTLRDKAADKLYVYDSAGGVLQAADIKDKTLTPVASKVLAFWPYLSDTVLYATDDGAATGKVLVKLRQSDKAYTLRELPVGQTYLLNMAEFDNHLYIAAGVNTEGKVYVYRDPLNDLKSASAKAPLPRILLKVDSPEYVSFSGNARFIAVQGGGKFAVYDAENNRQIRYDTQLPLDAHARAEWMDGHRLTLISQGKLTVFDFDGTNKQTLNATIGTFRPMFDRDYNALFTISPSVSATGRTAIVRTELKLTQ